jgi:[acyl-carrier-protein] S-malonyltransferase
VVIAGSVAGVDKAIELCKEQGAKRAMLLPVSAPFHTSLMKPAGEKLAEKLAGISFNTPTIPVIHNVHGQTEVDPQKIKDLLVEQIFSPVKWVSCIEAMVAAGIEKTVECGPGKVLSGLNKRVNKSIQSFTIETPDGLDKALTEI